ncbi:hypothetical protein COU60_02375 [Candidatus Pacearchaeota archaeon CG10_big_fil_rev_8_21_14_0_10_34_76]|nr:MAG: hypothetical protein COU60_02375 [Candidatus Pacearchaeota archaeon CG10_big_fil_rev_8_21_14_0_10_34_76]
MKKILIGCIFIMLIAVISAFIFITSNQDKKVGDENLQQNTEEKSEDAEENKLSEPAQKILPVLMNLGLDIEPLNNETNLAGDLIFSKSLVYDDGRVSGDKVFVDFGIKEKYSPEGIGNIEYWFHVPLNTKVKAPTGGVVKIDYFEHTEDWGVNILPNDSDLIVSFEHLVNLMVKDGEYVTAGEFIGEAAPRNTFDDKIAMTELAVWKGGNTIIKYCPFDYLDESLKPVYQEKLNKLATEWEEFVDKDVYEQERWVSPGCLVSFIQEK